jgi:hypothetical protein
MAAPSDRKLVSRNRNCKLDRHKRITIKEEIANKNVIYLDKSKVTGDKMEKE